MTDTTTDTRTPEGLMQTFTACIDAGDLDALVALYEPDAVFEAQPAPPSTAPAPSGRRSRRCSPSNPR